MGVKIHIAPYLQQYSENKATIEVAASSLGECLQQLVTRFPQMENMLFLEKDKLLPYVALYVNLADSYPDQLEKVVKEGDEVHISYVIVGG